MCLSDLKITSAASFSSRSVLYPDPTSTHDQPSSLPRLSAMLRVRGSCVPSRTHLLTYGSSQVILITHSPDLLPRWPLGQWRLYAGSNTPGLCWSVYQDIALFRDLGGTV